MAALAVSWGFTSVIVAHVDLSAPVLVVYRTFIAAGTVALLLLAVGGASQLRLPHSRLPVALIGLTLGVHWLLFFETIKLSSVAVALVTVYLGPVLISIAAPSLLPELRNRVALFALAPAVVGISLIALVGGEAERPSATALLAGLGTAATYAVLVIALKRYAEDLPAGGVQVWTALVAGLVALPFAAFSGRALPHPAEVPYVLALGALATGVSWLVYITLLRRVPAQTVGVVSYLEVVSAALLARLLLDQPLRWNVVAGGALIVAAGVAVVLAEPERAPPPLEAV
jgi:drug/metabolite transporter (DMT)-like permease